jgi:hypothetical protein
MLHVSGLGIWVWLGDILLAQSLLGGCTEAVLSYEGRSREGSASRFMWLLAGVSSLQAIELSISVPVSCWLEPLPVLYSGGCTQSSP